MRRSLQEEAFEEDQASSAFRFEPRAIHRGTIHIYSLADERIRPKTSNMSREANATQLAITNPQSEHTVLLPCPAGQDSTNALAVAIASQSRKAGTLALVRRTITAGISVLPWCAKCHALQRHDTQCNAYTIVITMPIGYQREN